LGILITGIVGVAGIGGTILAAWMTGRSQTVNLKLSIDAENDRANRAEKRRVYAHFHACFAAVIRPTVMLRAAYQPGAPQADRVPAESTLGKAHDALFEATGELMLLAPPPVNEIAEKVLQSVLDYADATHAGEPPDDSFAAQLEELENSIYSAMRADLGVPDEPVSPVKIPQSLQ